MQESWASSPAARKTMQGNRGRDTTPEVAVRRIVHGKGLRYRVNARPEACIRRTADLLFRRRIAAGVLPASRCGARLIRVRTADLDSVLRPITVSERTFRRRRAW